MLLLIVLWLKLQKLLRRKKLTIVTLEKTTKISDLEFTKLKMMLKGLNQQLKNYQKLRSVPLANFIIYNLRILQKAIYQ